MNAKQWRAGVTQIHQEAAGLLNVDIISSEAGVRLVVAAAFGDAEARTILLAIKGLAEDIKRSARKSPKLCVCCPRHIKRVTPATIFGVASPANPGARQALGLVFCDTCVAQPESLMVKATNALKGLWPELRPVNITHAAPGAAQ